MAPGVVYSRTSFKRRTGAPKQMWQRERGDLADLAVIVGLSILLAVLAAFTTGPLRIALGVLFVLFFPGYTLVAALFPRRGSLDPLERTALSFGLSLAVVPLMGLLLNFTPWGIRPNPVLVSLLLFIIIMAAVAWHRRHRLAPEERFGPRLLPRFTSLSHSWKAQGTWGRTLTLLLVLAVVGGVTTAAYAISRPKTGERFTEFYILGREGRAENYPSQLVLGDEGRVTVGIVNQEHETTTYRVEVTIDAETVGVRDVITLDHQGKWEEELGFVPTRAGPRQKVEFLLYKGTDQRPSRTLHLWLDVSQAR